MQAEIEEHPITDVALEALAYLAGAYLKAVGRDEALAMLRALASDLDADEGPVVNFSDGPNGNRAKRLARVWARRELTIWLAKHG